MTLLDLDTLPYMPARWSIVPASPRPLGLIVVHCTVTGERAGTAIAVQRGFASPTARPGSTHTIVDPIHIVRSVRDEHIAYGASGANKQGLHVEICGQPTQTREQWLDTDSRSAIRNAGRCIAAWCHRHHIPAQLVLDPGALRSGLRGITSHAAVQKAWPSTGHWDPGPAFPWDVLMGDIDAELSTVAIPPLPPISEDDDMSIIVGAAQPNGRRAFAGPLRGTTVPLENGFRLGGDPAWFSLGLDGATQVALRLDRVPISGTPVGLGQADGQLVVGTSDGATYAFPIL